MVDHLLWQINCTIFGVDMQKTPATLYDAYSRIGAMDPIAAQVVEAKTQLNPVRIVSGGCMY